MRSVDCRQVSCGGGRNVFRCSDSVRAYRGKELVHSDMPCVVCRKEFGPVVSYFEVYTTIPWVYFKFNSNQITHLMSPYWVRPGIGAKIDFDWIQIESTVRVAYYEHLFIMNQAEGPNRYILIAFVLNKVRLI